MTICRKDDIDCPIMIARWCRSKFWFVFVALFVLWFSLLHVIDWSSPPIPATSISDLNHATNSNPLASSLDSDSDISSVKPDIDQDLVGNISRVFSEEIDGAESVHENESGESVVNDDKIDGIKEEGKNVAVEIDWVEDVQQLNALQKELEPLVGGNEEEEEDHKKVEETIKKEDPKVAIKRPCNGRYVYIHDLPSRYNEDLLKQCRSLNKWADMCQSMVTAGLGPRLGNPQRVFSTTGWYSTNQFMLEVIFHNRMKQYECLTNDSSLASAIFVPYYPGLDVARYLWGFNMSMRDSASLDLAKWLREKPEWKGMYGRDHFLVAGRITWDFRRGIDEEDAWGNKFMLLPEFKNTTVLAIESSPWNSNDFGIPYPTYFHPANDNEVFRWQNKMRKQRRKSLFCFAGAPRPHLEESIRKEVMDQCIASRRKCRLLECTNERNKCLKPVYLMKLFQNSVFCLQPPGDSFTRRSTFDSILAGCIPVFFSPGSAYVQYLWHLPRDFSKYSVLIPEDDVKENKVSIERVLSEIPRSKVKDMREEVIKLIPKVIYADPRSRLEKLNDAFDLTVDGVLERVENLRKEIREGKNSSIENDEENSWKYYLFGTTEKHEWDHFFRRTNRGRY